MQTTQNNILSFDASIQGGVKKQTSQKQSNSKDGDDSEFLSMVLNAAAKKDGSITEKDINEIANAVNMSAQTKEALISEPIATINVEEILGEEMAGELFENATFMQLLQILEMLNGGEQISKYPNFSSQLAKALSSETTINELREAKNITELIDIANKLNLGLENITITKDQVEELNAKFPTLAKNNFFTPVTPKNIVVNRELKVQVEENIQAAQKSEPVLVLNKLLQDVNHSKQDKVAPQTPTIKEQSIVQTQNLEQIPEVITDEVKSIQNKIELPKNDVKIETKDEKKISLQSLLYPEREQNFNSESESEANQNSNEQNSNNPLNLMVRDIISNAKSQAKNHQMIKETFDNFNLTLKEQVAAYKSPFMRFNITLNPLNLGEVEITMVNRGNNLHINFNSNTNTMNLFLQNQAEFKNSLVNMGFTELEMNFNDQGQQKKEQGQRAYKNNKNDKLDEILDEITQKPSLELVIPRYI
jgi:flagellar hook-length control protein fliK